MEAKNFSFIDVSEQLEQSLSTHNFITLFARYVSVPEDLFQAYNTRHSVQNRWCLSFTECTQFPHTHNFLTHPTSNFLTHPTCKYPCLTYQQNFLPRYWFFKGSPKRKTNLHHCKTLGAFGLFMFCSFFTFLAGY